MSVSSPKADLPAVLILGRKADVGDRRQIQNERLCNEDKPLYGRSRIDPATRRSEVLLIVGMKVSVSSPGLYKIDASRRCASSKSMEADPCKP